MLCLLGLSGIFSCKASARARSAGTSKLSSRRIFLLLALFLLKVAVYEVLDPLPEALMVPLSFISFEVKLPLRLEGRDEAQDLFKMFQWLTLWDIKGTWHRHVTVQGLKQLR